MKIDPNMIIGAVTGKVPGVKQTTGSANIFEGVLQDVQNIQGKEIAGVQPLHHIDQLNPQKIKALSLSEQAVDMLDAYSKSLADPKISLKDLAPMVNEISEMRSSLLDAGSFLSDDDQLKGVMNEVASAMNGEVLRFRRGDLIG